MLHSPWYSTCCVGLRAGSAGACTGWRTGALWSSAWVSHSPSCSCPFEFSFMPGHLLVTLGGYWRSLTNAVTSSPDDQLRPRATSHRQPLPNVRSQPPAAPDPDSAELAQA